MNNFKNECINLIKENHCKIIKTNNDAEKVFDALKDVIMECHLKDFINEDLCVFSNKTDAFNWFFSDEGDILESIKNITITNNMVGKNMEDIIKDEVLLDRENYIKVNENIHLTYWQ